MQDVEVQETPSHFDYTGKTDEWDATRSVYVSGHGYLMRNFNKRISVLHPITQDESWIDIGQTPMSVCMDDEYGYALFKDGYIRKFDLSYGKILHKWPVPMNAPIQHQMTVIDGNIYYCNVNNSEIIIFPACKESSQMESIMSLGTLEKPAYISDNTKHQEETVIISGASGVGKFPVRHGFSQPEWFTTIKHARGICVDGRGLVYVAKCEPSAIYLLSQQTGV